jgi:hypothetical protein
LAGFAVAVLPVENYYGMSKCWQCAQLFGALLDLAEFAGRLGVSGSQSGQGMGFGCAAWYECPASGGALLWRRLPPDTGTLPNGCSPPHPYPRPASHAHCGERSDRANSQLVDAWMGIAASQ